MRDIYDSWDRPGLSPLTIIGGVCALAVALVLFPFMRQFDWSSVHLRHYTYSVGLLPGQKYVFQQLPGTATVHVTAQTPVDIEFGYCKFSQIVESDVTCELRNPADMNVRDSRMAIVDALVDRRQFAKYNSVTLKVAY